MRLTQRHEQHGGGHTHRPPDALVSHASGIILSHNHPSGSTVASTPDNNLTSQLKKGCEAIGIQLLDHIILTEDTYLSYMDEGML